MRPLAAPAPALVLQRPRRRLRGRRGPGVLTAWLQTVLAAGWAVMARPWTLVRQHGAALARAKQSAVSFWSTAGVDGGTRTSASSRSHVPARHPAFARAYRAQPRGLPKSGPYGLAGKRQGMTAPPTHLLGGQRAQPTPAFFPCLALNRVSWATQLLSAALEPEACVAEGWWWCKTRTPWRNARQSESLCAQMGGAKGHASLPRRQKTEIVISACLALPVAVAEEAATATCLGGCTPVGG